MTRRRFLGSTAVVAGTVAGADLLAPRPAFADSGAGVPRPIPGGLTVPFVPGHLFHVFLIPNQKTADFDEQLTITDFNGKVAAAHLGGTVAGVDDKGATIAGLTFDVDNRFLSASSSTAMDTGTTALSPSFDWTSLRHRRCPIPPKADPRLQSWYHTRRRFLDRSVSKARRQDRLRRRRRRQRRPRCGS